VDGGAVKYVYSDDGGGSWSVPATIWSAGSHPAADVSPGGWQLVAMRTSGGAVKVKKVQRDGTVIAGEFTAVGSGVADDSIAVSYDAAAQRWYIGYIDGGGAVARVYSDDGETWS
jgi:hypothetical protein